MGSAGTIIGWIVQLFPLLTGLLQQVIDAFKKKPAPPPAADGSPAVAEELVLPTGTVLAFLMHVMSFLMPLIEDGVALAKAEPGVELPVEVKDKAGEAAKLLSDLAQALTGLEVLVPAVKVIQELSDVLAALAA